MGGGGHNCIYLMVYVMDYVINEFLCMHVDIIVWIVHFVSN